MNTNRVMQIQSYHPGHSVEEIKEKTGFEMLVASNITETPVPGQDVIDLLSRIDSDGIRNSEFK